MGHYNSREAAPAAQVLQTSREDIIKYQEDLSRYVAKFQIERREAEYLLQEARNAQDKYRTVVEEQNEKINQLTT
ncbi:hypothetical protein, partial [Herbiconiux daphne]